MATNPNYASNSPQYAKFPQKLMQTHIDHDVISGNYNKYHFALKNAQNKEDLNMSGIRRSDLEQKQAIN